MIIAWVLLSYILFVFGVVFLDNGVTLRNLFVSMKECLVKRCASSDGKEPFLLIGFLYSRSLESLGQLVEVLVFSSKYCLICSPLVGLT